MACHHQHVLPNCSGRAECNRKTSGERHNKYLFEEMAKSNYGLKVEQDAEGKENKSNSHNSVAMEIIEAMDGDEEQINITEGDETFNTRRQEGREGLTKHNNRYSSPSML